MDKRAKIKAGLSFGIFMAIFFIAQNLLTHDNLTTKNIITPIIVGLFTGALSGVLFGWLMGLFANSKFVAQTTKIDTDADEIILFETGANHFKGAEGVGRRNSISLPSPSRTLCVMRTSFIAFYYSHKLLILTKTN